ncbi:MAG: hypothetical protein HFJ58_07540, partial [Clostridia bacterium]|nr:hypothetical protein [Clostridia bacterium]
RSVPEIAQSLGKETEFKKDTRGKAKFIYDTETQNVAKVDVTIEIDASISGYTVQYNIVENSDTSTNWVDYTAGSIIEVRKNITIYGRIIDKTTNEIGYKFSSKISTIDALPPQSATITFNKEQATVEETIEATVTQSDLETGIDIEKCKYIIDKNKDKLGENNEVWETASNFNENPKNINITESNPGTYYLHVLSVDITGNKIETVSKGIKFLGTVTFLNTDSHFNIDEWILVAGQNKGRLTCSRGNSLHSVRYFSKLKASDFEKFTFSFGGFGVSPGEAKLLFGLYRDANLTDPVIEDSVLNNEVRPLTIDMKNVENGEYFLGVSFKWISDRDWYSFVSGQYRIVGLGK